METLRCLKCQSQSIADSDAPMAGDMRHQVRSRIAAGEEPEAIRAWLVERYGDYVSYAPRVSATDLAAVRRPAGAAGAGGAAAAAALRPEGAAMSWLLADRCSAVAAFASWRCVLRRRAQGWAAIGAALLLGLAGYALQGQPGPAGRAHGAGARRDGDAAALVEARQEMVGRRRRAGQLAGRSPTRSPAAASTPTPRECCAARSSENPHDAEAWLALGNALVEHAEAAHAGGALAYRSAAEPRRSGASGPAVLPRPGADPVGPARRSARAVGASCSSARPADAPWRRGPGSSGSQRLDALIAAARARGDRPLARIAGARLAAKRRRSCRRSRQRRVRDRRSDGRDADERSAEPAATGEAPPSRGDRAADRAITAPQAACSSWRSARSASSSAISAPARSTPCARRSPGTIRCRSIDAARVRRRQPDVLVDDDHRDAQVRHHHHARRQQGRGRQPGAAGADQPQDRRRALDGRASILLGVFATALFYGDSMITPGDLGAVGGRGPGGRTARRSSGWSCRSRSASWSACSSSRARGTARVGKLFGPIMLVYFATLAVLGVISIVEMPGVILRRSTRVTRCALHRRPVGAASWRWARWCWR